MPGLGFHLKSMPLIWSLPLFIQGQLGFSDAALVVVASLPELGFQLEFGAWPIWFLLGFIPRQLGFGGAALLVGCVNAGA